MKLLAYYYLDYPDHQVDPGYVATTMYVELGEDDGPVDHILARYVIQVYTYRYVQREFFEKRIPLVERSVLIVPEIEDRWMDKFLVENLERLGDWGELRF